jgi:hypothetical protein
MGESMTIRGRCLCGHVAYEYSGSLGPAHYCHCEDCRRCTGSAFNTAVRIDRAAFRLTGGEVKGFTKRGDSGNELTRHFCPECGSPVYTASPRHPEYIFVKAGTFDDPTMVNPIRQFWMSSAVPWRRIAENIPSFEKGAE